MALHQDRKTEEQAAIGTLTPLIVSSHLSFVLSFSPFLSFSSLQPLVITASLTLLPRGTSAQCSYSKAGLVMPQLRAEACVSRCLAKTVKKYHISSCLNRTPHHLRDGHSCY